MSGSEFERDNIVANALSVAPASKPADIEPMREHTWRPPAEGLYDPSLEKDSCGVDFLPLMLAMKPTPQESFSRAGS